METQALEVTEIVVEQHADQEQQELQIAARQLMDSELLFVGGGGGDVVW